MTEKDLQRLFGKWVTKHPPCETEAYEFKIVKGLSFPFDRVESHQVEALLKAEQKGLYHKINDQPWGRDQSFRFTSKKPFDAFCLVNVKSYLILWFYVPRKPKVFQKIRITDFLKLQQTIGKKSVREVEIAPLAQQIAL